jgi:hypothetical protein
MRPEPLLGGVAPIAPCCVSRIAISTVLVGH